MWTQKGKILVQGITEPLGSHYAAKMKANGTNIVAGISAGQRNSVDDIPVFDLVEEVVLEIGEIETTLIFVPAYAVLDAAREAIASGIKQIIIVSRGVPPLDMVRLFKQAQETNTLVIGPGSGGIIIPEQIQLGTHEPNFYRPGNIGIISRTNTLSYEVALELNRSELGQSFAVSLGDEGIIGSTFEQWLSELEADKATEAIVLIGKARGMAEEAVAQSINDVVKKPVIVYLAGLHSPAERPFMDAATIVANRLSYSVPITSKPKQIIAAFQKAKLAVAKRPADIPDLIHKALQKINH